MCFTILFCYIYFNKINYILIILIIHMLYFTYTLIDFFILFTINIFLSNNNVCVNVKEI